MIKDHSTKVTIKITATTDIPLSIDMAKQMAIGDCKNWVNRVLPDQRIKDLADMCDAVEYSHMINKCFPRYFSKVKLHRLKTHKNFKLLSDRDKLINWKLFQKVLKKLEDDGKIKPIEYTFELENLIKSNTPQHHHRFCNWFRFNFYEIHKPDEEEIQYLRVKRKKTLKRYQAIKPLASVEDGASEESNDEQNFLEESFSMEQLKLQRDFYYKKLRKIEHITSEIKNNPDEYSSIDAMELIEFVIADQIVEEIT